MLRGSRTQLGVVELDSVAATQDALYRKIDLALSWSERELPERTRTKHVHRLHPYLGKFIPQLVEELLARYVPPGGAVLDPFAGSGTTLVQSLESGHDATGVDIAGFNALLMRVKTAAYDLNELRGDLMSAHDAAAAFEPRGRYPARASAYLRDWFAPRAAEELDHFRSLVPEARYPDVLRVVLARSARSARRTTHFDLDFPREPQSGEYWCHKHKRTCRPVQEARRFLLRYARDTLDRMEAFAGLRAEGRTATVVHGDGRLLDPGGHYAGVITSPPYPGLIDYHGQHRYAYELLGIDEHPDGELGRPALGTGRAALAAYSEGVAAVLRNACSGLASDGRVCIVVNDRRDLYPAILEQAGLRLEERLERHVNRRTGRRAGEYYESILVAVQN